MVFVQLLILLDCWIRQVQEGRDGAQTWMTFSFEFSKLPKLQMRFLMASKAVVDTVNWAASRTAVKGKNMLRVARRISGFKFPRNSSRIAIDPLVGHRVPRWVPEEPNKPNLMDLIRSSPFSRLRTIVWPRLNFQVQCVSVW
ncbi:hypothetical protein E3N88_29463 [Mikania micrantha]|uniref:Uncharacterized protein n=1 Tax=Mikania micrantha TaxID=192012 RepID=A0A5N6MJ42_9ASTR|nr:hypothetical protein E3N88_29463 [Mikania micrantha]